MFVLLATYEITCLSLVICLQTIYIYTRKSKTTQHYNLVLSAFRVLLWKHGRRTRCKREPRDTKHSEIGIDNTLHVENKAWLNRPFLFFPGILERVNCFLWWEISVLGARLMAIWIRTHVLVAFFPYARKLIIFAFSIINFY